MLMNDGQADSKLTQHNLPSENPTATALLLEVILLTAQDLGLDRNSICQDVLGQGFPTPGPQQRIEETLIIQLLEYCRTQTGNRNFGLLVGSHSRLGTYGALGYALMNCRTLGEAFGLIPRYESVVLDSGLTRHFEQNERHFLTWDRNQGLPCPSLLVDVFFSSWLSLASWMTGQTIRCDELHLKSTDHSDRGIYETFFQTDVKFGQAHNALVFRSGQALDQPLIEADPQLNHLMIERLEKIHRQLHQPDTIGRKLARLIREQLPTGNIGIARLADRLAMSERTLRRRLTGEGKSYNELLTEMRHQMACDYLQNTEFSILEIALLLGYREHSSFSAAFKNWQSCSPQEFRQQQGKQSAPGSITAE